MHNIISYVKKVKLAITKLTYRYFMEYESCI